MNLSQKQLVPVFRTIFPLLVCALFGTGSSFAQSPRDAAGGTAYEIYRYPSRTLSPVYTGEKVSSGEQPEKRPGYFAVKTNLAYLATLTPNLYLETALGRHISLEVGGGYHPWKEEVIVTPPGGDESTRMTVDGKRLEHWLAKTELRYWFDRPFSKHFLGISGVYGQYDMGGYEVPMLFEKEYFYDGDVYGGSLVYGYHWAFSRKWRLELSLGIGALQLNYDQRECVNDYCAAEIKKYKKYYFGPTQVGVKMVFMIR